MRRTYKSKKTFGSSRARSLARQKRSRAAAASQARLRRVVKKTVMTTHDRRRTLFNNMNLTVSIPRSDQFYGFKPLDAAAIFPQLGNNENSRDSERYYLESVNVFMALDQGMQNDATYPLDIYVVKANPRVTLSNGIRNNEVMWKWTLSSDAVTWPRLPHLVGPLDKDFGRIVKKYRIQPKSQRRSADGLAHQATAADAGYELKHHTICINIPIKKRIHCLTSSSEIPYEVPPYYVVLHAPGNFVSTAATWILEYAYSQAVFRELS